MKKYIKPTLEEITILNRTVFCDDSEHQFMPLTSTFSKMLGIKKESEEGDFGFNEENNVKNDGGFVDNIDEIVQEANKLNDDTFTETGIEDNQVIEEDIVPNEDGGEQID